MNLHKSNLLFLPALIISMAIVSFSSCKDDEEPERNIVYIGSAAFNPSTVTIPVGGTIIWENDDSQTHTVTSNTGLFDSGDLSPDETFSYTFADSGTYHYHCVYHGSMGGMVIVQ